MGRVIVQSLVVAMALASCAYGNDIETPDTTDVSDSVLVPPVDSTALDTIAADSVVQMDTLLFSPGGALAIYSPVSDSTDREKLLSQKPMFGLLKSMVLPGWGQFGNQRYIKAAVYFGLETWMVLGAVHYGGQASSFRRLFDDTPIDNNSLRNDYYDLYTDRKDERNKMTWFAIIIAFVSMFDAYVDAHLSGFPRQGELRDLSLQVAPTEDNGVAAAVAIRF